MNKLGKISKKTAVRGQASMIEIDDRAAGQRIDNFLLCICKGIPKDHIYRILRSGEVRVNKGRVSANYRLMHGDIVRKPPVWHKVVDLIRSDTSFIPLSNFSILYEDDVLLVIDKPKGFAVHGGSGIRLGVIEQMRQLYSHLKFIELVHRLDRDTSGILMLAKKRAALVALHKQIRDNKLEKRYLTCAYGKWSNNWGNRHAVNVPLFKYTTVDGERRVRVQHNGLASYTVFNLIKYWPDVKKGQGVIQEEEIGKKGTSEYSSSGYSFIEVELKTGRTHQIRAHLTYLGLPIVGDQKYGDFSLNKTLKRTNAKPSLNRMFLHAYYIRFFHPITGKSLEINSPLPIECKNFLKELSAINTSPSLDFSQGKNLCFNT
ncbi:MAG: pseudouridine synthase [Burkholderia sp.]|nr:pseudouridine synthase [Burkholderia sp.]